MGKIRYFCANALWSAAVFLAPLSAFSREAVQAALEAYRTSEESIRISCAFDSSSWGSSLPEQIEFARKYRPHFREEGGEFTAHGFVSSGRLEFKGGQLAIRISVSSHLEYEISVRYADGIPAIERGRFRDYEPIPLPGLDLVQDANLKKAYELFSLSRMKCRLGLEYQHSFEEADLGTKIHIVVHPHTYYDPAGKLSHSLGSLLGAPGLRHLMLLERPRRRGRQVSEILSGLPFRVTDPELSHLPTHAEYREAPNGVIEFSPYDRRLPQNYILSGGMFNACMTHALDALFASLRRGSETDRLYIELPMRAILVQPEGEDGLHPLPETGTVLTLFELKRDHPQEYSRLLESYVRYHFRNWQNDLWMDVYHLHQKKTVRFEIRNEQGEIIASESSAANREREDVRITFKLLD